MTMQHGIPDISWDDALIAAGGNFLQSSHWAKFSAALGRETLYNQGDGWSWSGSLRHGRGGVAYLSIPSGPTVRDESAFADAVASIEEAARAKRAIFARIEPVGGVTSVEVAHCATSFGEVNPTHTHILDLTQSEEELRSGLESGHRNRVNGAERRGITVDVAGADNISEFLAMMDDTARRNHIKPYPHDYYQKLYEVLNAENASSLYLASHEGSPIAAALSFDFGQVRYYAHAAAYQDLNRKIGASVVLVWQMIQDAKRYGRSQFDFWGVAPEAATNHKWAGLSAFKRGFGGVDKNYVGTHDVVINTTKYRLYRMAKKIM